MKKRALVLVVGLLLIGFNVYAADGDLIVNGNVGVGTTSPQTPLEVYSAGPDNIYATRVSGDSVGAAVSLLKARTGPAIVQSGDVLGRVTFRGYDGSGYIIAAQIKSKVEATPGASDMPGALLFLTTPDGSTSLTERMRINNPQKCVKMLFFV